MGSKSYYFINFDSISIYNKREKAWSWYLLLSVPTFKPVYLLLLWDSRLAGALELDKSNPLPYWHYWLIVQIIGKGFILSRSSETLLTCT